MILVLQTKKTKDPRGPMDISGGLNRNNDFHCREVGSYPSLEVINRVALQNNDGKLQ